MKKGILFKKPKGVSSSAWRISMARARATKRRARREHSHN